jgi:prepilin-type N-terminal cleavage/methylation domain-containing protein
MKVMQMGLSNKKGFTLLELIVVMVIITIIASQVISSFKGASENGRVAAALNSIKAIQTAAMSYFNNNGGSCTGISVTTLVSGNYLPGSFTGTNANPWGGNYIVAVNANNATQFNLSMTNISQTNATTLNSALQNSAQAVNYVATSSTWTGTF